MRRCRLHGPLTVWTTSFNRSAFRPRSADLHQTQQKISCFQLSFRSRRTSLRRPGKKLLPFEILQLIWITLYMTAKNMRLRVSQAIRHTFRCSGNIENITRKMIENRDFLEHCVENNLVFMKSIPNSMEYWSTKNKNLFAMMRQLGKPSVFLTMSANEIRWSHLLKILYKLKNESEEDIEDPIKEFSAADRVKLVNDDAVTCCIYFWKLMLTIMRLLKSTSYCPFGRFIVLDHFLRVEFQHRGSPHVHVLLWLLNDPKETISENMPRSIALIESL